MELALAVDRGFGRALVGECRLHREIALTHRGVVHLGAAVEFPQPQREHFGGEATFVLLHRLVAARGRGLALQMADLLLDLVAQVLQPLEVLARIADAALGFAPPLLVARNARRLLDEGPHVLGLRLDDARNHALLDDRVAARAEAGAEEQLRDVAPPAARAIDEVGRGAVARHLALQRNLAVARIGPGDLAVRVVEHELDVRGADRLARARAVEDHVGHRVAAQMARRQFAHDPAHGVDDVRLATTVRADDTRQVVRETDQSGIDEGFEARELDLGESHQGG